MAEKKTGLASISEGRSDIHRIDPRLLKIKDNWNCRDEQSAETKAHIEMLALSIAEIGVQEPVTVYWEDNTAWISDGHCRLWATMLAIKNGADIKTIPAKSEQRYANEADRLFSQIIRNAGKPFSQMEQAKVYKRLLDMGWQQQDIARKAGLSPARISQVLDLLALPELIKQMVTNGEVSASMAVNTVAVHNPQKAVQVLQDAVAIAKEAGKAKAMPKHLNGAAEGATVPATKSPKKVRDLDAAKVCHEAFEYALVDEEQINDQGEAVVVVTFPVEWFEKMREALKL